MDRFGLPVGAAWYSGAEVRIAHAGKPDNVTARKKINLLHLSTIIAVGVLVGTEVVGASWAAGWALGGLLQFEPTISRIFEAFFALCGFVLLFYFLRTALKNESIRQ